MRVESRYPQEAGSQADHQILVVVMLGLVGSLHS